MKSIIKIFILLIFISTTWSRDLETYEALYIINGYYQGEIMYGAPGGDFYIEHNGKILDIWQDVVLSELTKDGIFKIVNISGGYITGKEKIIGSAAVFIYDIIPINKPPDLSIEDIEFKTNPKNIPLDRRPDILYAASDGTLEFDLINNGHGLGQVMVVNFEMEEDNLIYSKNLFIAKLNPGEKKHISLPISAKNSSKSKNHEMKIWVTEYNGFDLAPVTTTITVWEGLTPSFNITNLSIDDDKDGKSYGNNNKKINRGESIEIKTLLTNIGLGESKETKIELIVQGTHPSGLILSDENKIFYVENLLPGETVEVNISFMINKRYTGRTIPLALRVTEKSGEFTKEFDLDLTIKD